MHHRIRRALGLFLGTAVLSSGFVALELPVAQAAYPVPPTPSGLPRAIEALQPYVGQSVCDAVAKPGITAFRDLLLRTYPGTGNLGIVRSCSAGGQSEHKEGRAFDWGVSAYNSRQKAEVDTLLAWLLKTDGYGNSHAMARRLGIMYMIWNKRIWKSYQASEGWQPYGGASPHTDHVHFSFGWNAAKKVTSYWDKTVAPVYFGPNPPPSITPVRRVSNIKVVRDNGGTTLGIGSKGDAVKAVQRELKVPDVDGDFGARTAAHVAQFQIDQRLPMTQRFGPEEWKRLFPFPVNPFGTVSTTTYALGTAVVRGWAIDADSQDPVEIRVYLDGATTPAATTSATLPRSDVGKSYPEWGPARGYAVALAVDDGPHEICVVAVNVAGTPGTNSKLACRSVDAQHSPVGAINALKTSLGQVQLSAWALDPDTAEPVTTELLVDGVPADVSLERVARSDVAALYPALGGEHGLTGTLELAEGVREVCLVAHNAPGTPGTEAVVGCRSVEVRHTPVGALEVVRRTPAGVLVGGWGFDPDSADPVRVDVMEGGAVLQPLLASRTRADVAQPEQGEDVGFAVTLTLPAGVHQLCAVLRNATGTAGQDRPLGCRSVTVSHEPTGVVRALRTVPGGAVAAAGDAYDPDTLGAATVQVLVDGVLARSVVASAASSTAAKRWPGYGSAHGFSTQVKPSAGRHSVCVRVLNAAGEGSSRTLECRKVVVHDGTGQLTSLARSGRTILVRGWALDPDTSKANVAALVVDGRVIATVRASGLRRDMATLAPGYGSYHAFAFKRTLTKGKHRVCAVSRNYAGTAGHGRYIGCRVITV